MSFDRTIDIAIMVKNLFYVEKKRTIISEISTNFGKRMKKKNFHF